MTPEEIEDRESLTAWLGSLPTGSAAERDGARLLSVALAHRAAMRVLPIVVETESNEQSPSRNFCEITVFRQNLTAGVAATHPSPKIKFAAADIAPAASAYSQSDFTAPSYTIRAAAEAVSAAAASASFDDAATAAEMASAAFASFAYGPDGYGMNAAYAADIAETAMWSAIRADCVLWEVRRSLECIPLWSVGSSLVDHWRRIREDVLARGAGWAFWVNWYDKALNGEPQDWAGLLTEVALIPPEEWDMGADHVNALIAEIRERYAIGSATPLANAAVADFSFDDFLREMRMVGFDEDTAHLHDPEQVQRFRDDVEEVRDEFQDFVDYAQDITSGGNQARPLSRGTEKVLDEFDLIESRGTIRAARLIRLGHRLHQMSLEPDKRAPLGETLAKMLDSNVALLLGLCRKYFAPSLNRLEPLGELQLGNASADAIVADLRRALDALAENDGAVLARMDQGAQAVFRDMLEEVEDIRAALDSAQSSAQTAHLRKRLAESVGAFGVTLGRYAKKAAPHAERAGEWVDKLIKNFNRVKSLQAIWEWIETFLKGPPPP